MPDYECEDQNWVALSGVIADTPIYTTPENKPCVRFKLEVHCCRPGLAHIETLLVSIAVYGEPAKRSLPFLRRGGRIGVFGKVDIRAYVDTDSGKPRTLQEIAVVELLPSFGADWDRGALHLENLGLQQDTNCAILSHGQSTRK